MKKKIIILLILFFLFLPISVATECISSEATELSAFAEYYFHNDIDSYSQGLTQDIWNNTQVFSSGPANGTIYKNVDVSAPNNMTILINGTYRLSYSITFLGNANNKYHVVFGVNNTQKLETESHNRVGTGNDIQTGSGTGIVMLNVGDNVTLQMLNEDGNNPAAILSVNMNIELINSYCRIVRRSNKMIESIYILIILLGVLFAIIAMEIDKKNIFFPIFSMIFFFAAALLSFQLTVYEGAYQYDLNYSFFSWLWAGMGCIMLMYIFHIQANPEPGGDPK